jgi:actin-like ATPase involved in cell morphogenesis
MPGIGFDCGTYNLICSKRGENGEVKSRKEVNAFLEIPLDNRFTFNMMKKAKVPLIERDNIAYVVGEAAVNLAYTLQLDLKRPMKDGCLNPTEKDAFRILSIMIHSLIGEVTNDKEVIYYSVPSNAVNQETDADYHQKVLEDIFKKYKVKDKTIEAFPINEGLALIFAELMNKQYTGIGISFGAGMVNLCYAKWSTPVFQISSVNSGDWIDKMAAKATGESTTVINREKTKVDLLKSPTSLIERAIQAQYRILIEKTIATIRKAITEAGNKIRTEVPLDIVIGGGTASPNGFEQLVREAIESSPFPVPLGEIIKPKDHLYAVARGCLVAAENAV